MIGINRGVPARSSIHYKLVFSYILIITILIVAGVVLYYNMINKEFKRKYIDSVHYNLKQLAYTLEDQISTAFVYADVLSRDKDILFLSKTESISSKELVMTTAYGVIPVIEATMAQNKNIEGIRLLHGNGNIFDIYDFICHEREITEGGWEAKLKSLCRSGQNYKNGIVIEYSSEGNHLTPAGDLSAKIADRDVWYIYRSIYSSNLSTLNSIIEIRLANEKLCRPIEEYNCSLNEFVLMVDENKKVIFSGNPKVASYLWEQDLDPSDLPDFEIDKVRYFPVSKKVNLLNCWVIQCIPVQNASMDNRSIILYSLFALMSIIVLYFVTLLVSKAILSKLRVLSNTMNSICHGNMEERVNIKSNDEIGLLADNFNDMLDRIKKAAETEQKLIYRQLSDQLSPHFLCNALDMVRMSAKVRKQTDISEAIELIARYFRNNLRAAAGTITIQEEFAYVRDYIEITNLIRDTPIAYDFNIDNSVAKVQIPRFITQPFVENSIKHGFRNKADNCHISIKALQKNGNNVLIYIEDNGSGIPEDKLKDICENALNDDDEGMGIGIANSVKRMNIYYKDSYNFTMESYVGAGTSVTISIAGILAA